jgi:acyl-CoA thioesterase
VGRGPSDFDADSAVERAAAGMFHARITDRWNTPAGPNGGYVLAIGVRAMADGVAFPDPIAVSGHFLRPPNPGPVEIRTETVRSGRRHATTQASMLQDGKEIVRALATFADLGAATGKTALLGEAPRLGPPEAAADLFAAAPDGFPRPSLGERIDYRGDAVPGWLRGEPTGDPSFELWMRLRDGTVADTVALTFLVDAAPPVVFELGGIVSSTVELTVHVRARPTTEWLMSRQRTRYVTSGYHDEDVELWDANGTLVAEARQLALLG